MKCILARDLKTPLHTYNLASYLRDMVMRNILISGLLFALLISGCSAMTPVPRLSPMSTMTVPPLPTATSQPKGPILPELNLEIRNEKDPLKAPYGVALDSSGKIYVNDAGNSRVLVLSRAGTLLAKWDRQGSGEGEFHSLGFGGIAIDNHDHVFVVDNGNHRIQKFDTNGNFLTEWGGEGKEDGEFTRAIGIATDHEGNVYVTDDANPFVQKFDNNGEFLMKWGGAGTGEGQFRHATGIAVDTRGNVFVSDYENKRVQKFDSHGNFLVAWGLEGESGATGIPEGIATDHPGRVYVTDYALGRIQIFDNDGNWLAIWGDKSIADPFFHRPVMMAFDTMARVYVVSQSTSNVQAFHLP